MKIGFLEIILLFSIFQLLIFTSFLLTKKPHKISNVFLSIFLLAQALGEFNSLTFYQAKFFFTSIPHSLLIGLPFCLVWGPSFYLYVKSLANKELKFKWNYLLHFIPFFIEVVLLISFFYFNDAESKRTILSASSSFLHNHFVVFSYFVMVQIFIYNIFSLYILNNFRKSLKENYSSIEKINYSWLNFFIIGYTIAHILSITIQISASNTEYNSVLRVILFLVFFVFFNIIFFKGWQQPEIFSHIEENVKYKSSRLNKQEAEEWKKKLIEIMDSRKPYLNPGLMLNQLADELEVSPRFLSQIINEHFNQNFYDYINKMRIEESKKMLVDSSSSKKTVLEILYDVGFNSKTAFNVAFKKATGLTPTEYRKRFSKENILSEQE